MLRRFRKRIWRVLLGGGGGNHQFDRTGELMAVPGTVLGQGKNSICRPGVPLGALGLGPCAVGPGVQCALQGAADVPPTATPAPQDESPMRAFWPQAQFPPNFVILGSDQHGSPPAYALSGLDFAPPRKFLYFCVPNLCLGQVMPGAKFRTCGSWAGLGAQGQGGWARPGSGR